MYIPDYHGCNAMKPCFLSYSLSLYRRQQSDLHHAPICTISHTQRARKLGARGSHICKCLWNLLKKFDKTNSVLGNRLSFCNREISSKRPKGAVHGSWEFPFLIGGRLFSSQWTRTANIYRMVIGNFICNPLSAYRILPIGTNTYR